MMNMLYAKKMKPLIKQFESNQSRFLFYTSYGKFENLRSSRLSAVLFIFMQIRISEIEHTSHQY